MISSSSTTRIVPLRDVAMGPTGRASRAGALDASARSGSVSVNRVPWPTRAVAANRAVVLVHDAVGDRQAEAGAAADRLRREERIVDAREMLRRNAGAGVGDLDDAAIRPSTRVDDRQPAAARHRVARVQEQVQEHLLQLVLDAERPAPAIGDSSRRTLIRADLELMLEQREHVADDGVEIDLDALAAAAAGRDRLSRPLTIFAARNVCRSIFSSSTVRGSSGSAPSSSICVKLEMPVSGVLTSCATPAASRPIDAIFSEICSCSSSRTRSVMSSMRRIVPHDRRGVARRLLQRHGGRVDEQPRARSRARRAVERHAVQRRAVRSARGAPRAAPRRTAGRRRRRAAARSRPSRERRRSARARGSSGRSAPRGRTRRGRRRATRGCCR